MNKFNNLLFSLALFLLQVIYTHCREREQKISDINVLLPVCESLNCNKVFYSVHAEGGCYEWSVDKPGYLDLVQHKSKEEPEGCFHKVQISPLNNRVKNEIVWLIARDRKSNEQFRCKVGFGKISKLQIEKTFEKMNLGEVTKINVNAFDENNNLFSSVNGFRFHWRITDGNVVQLLKLSQEKVKVGQIRLEVEKKSHSDIILLKGVNTGKVDLTAEILEEDYAGTLSDLRKLYVVEPFEIFPSEDLYIIPDNKFTFDLELIATTYRSIQSKRFVLPPNRRFYSWSLDNHTCGQVKAFGEYESNNKICTSKIIAEDTRIDQFNKAVNTIHVVDPTALDIAVIEISNKDANSIFSTVLPEADKINNYKAFEMKNKNDFDNSNTWKLVKGRSYLIKNILMHESHPISYSLNSVKFNIDFSNLDNYIVSLTCMYENEICLLITKDSSEDYLMIDSSVKTGTRDNVRQYSFVIRKNVKIFSEIKIEKFGQQIFSLPYLGYKSDIDLAPSSNETSVRHFDYLRSQELHLVVKGGTGHYVFLSENSDIIQIREEILFGKLPGKTRVKVTDADIPSNFEFVDIEVREVKDFYFLEERQEVQLGSEFYLTPIALKTISEYDETSFGFYANNAFTNCTNLKLNTSLSIKDKNIRDDSQRRNSQSNYDLVRSFLKSNRNLLMLKSNMMKIDYNEKENVNLKYLEYMNFGVCDSRGFIADNEGLIRVSIMTQILGKKTLQASINKIMSSHTAKVNVFSPITLISPKFEDIFTKELLRKANVEDPHKNRNFVLAVNSGVIVKFSGGVNPWPEYSRDYIEDVHLLDSYNNRTSSIELIRDQLKVSSQTIKEYFIECLRENEEKEIVVTMHNAKDKTLPRPARTSISISIACLMPKHLSIFFLGTNVNSIQSRTNMIKDDMHNDVFALPQHEGIEYYEKKNSVEIARVYAFDGNKRIFYNFTSLAGSWSQINAVTGKKLFSTLTEKDVKKYTGGQNILTDAHLSFNYPEYVHSTILFENEVSRFDLSYKLKTGLAHYVTINLIDFPTLAPNNATAYLSNENLIEINIQNGSGDFEISLNDESLAQYEYSRDDRKIVLTPLKQGVLYVYVKDNRINSGLRAIATIYISHIKKIQLIGGGLLMVNKTMNISMKVYDNFDNVFPFSQVKKMDLQVGDLEHISKGLQFSLDGIIPIGDQFTVKGLFADVYAIYVKDKISNITSNLLRVEVFDRLEVFPPSLLMVPGSSYTLSVKGGPVNEQHIIKKYQMVNSEIATVGVGEPQVKANLIGKTVLRIILALNPDYNKFYMTKEDSHDDKTGLVLAVEEVNVTVDFPDSVTIRGAVNRKVYTKSSVRLFAALKLGDETFTYGTGPFNFDWALDNTLIAKLRFFKSGREECQIKDSKECNVASNPVASYRNINPLNALGVVLSTSNAGTIDIKLTVTISYPNPYQWRRPNVFIKHEKIFIQDEIYVDIPEFYENIPNKSSLYLIPLNVDHELQTNKNNNYVKYSLISQHGTESNVKEHVLALQDTGRVTTYLQTGMAHILINQRDKENPAFIPVVLPVYVTDFYSLFAERSYQLIDLEIGQEVSLKVILQHEYGLLFASGKFERFQLRIVESHPGVAKAELTDHNSRVKIRANSKGETNIILFHPRTMQILDVFQVSVFSTLSLPQVIYLNVGGTVDFLKKDEKRKLYLSQDSDWISDDESIVQINREGTAVGLKEGSTNVHLVSKDRRKVKLSTHIHVVRVKKVAIDRSNLPVYLTDIKTSSYYKAEYHVPVNFYFDESSEELTSSLKDDVNEIDQKIMFKCIANNAEIFTAESVSLPSENLRECVLRIRDIPFNVRPPSNLDLVISVESKGGKSYDSYSYKSSFKIPFTSSFRIKNKVKELTLTKNNRTAFIYVDNLKDLSVEVEDEYLFKKEINTEDDENNYIKLYVPRNVTSNFNDLKMTLYNKATNQREEILLNYVHAEETKPETIFYGLIRRDTLIDFLTLMVLIVTIWILYNYLSGDSSQKKIIPGPNVSASRPPPGRSGVTMSAIDMNK